MKKYSKKLSSLLLVFALLMLSSCGEAHNSGDLSNGGGSASLLPFAGGSDIEWMGPSDSSVHTSAGDTVYGSDNSEGQFGTVPQGGAIGGGISSDPFQSGTNSSKSDNSSYNISSDVTQNKPVVNVQKGFDMKGIWISCFEMPFDNKNESEAKLALDEMMGNIATLGYNAVFCHVRPSADAFYPSKYFPFSKYINWVEGLDPGYDPLKIMISAAKKYGLKFHAWINPYRVTTTTTDPNELHETNIAAKWLTDSSERAVISGTGIYFNPGSTDVQQLILNGIREIVDGYDVDGIHFDDYFYPTTDPIFDHATYAKYKSSTSRPLSLDDWRRANVNALIASAYRICHDKNILFGISPAGDISIDRTDRNYTSLYADVALWLSTPGYADYIIPQLYYGYEHTYARSRYNRLLSIWNGLPRHSNLKLYIGLGAYKMDEECEDKAEWHNDATLMARQACDAKSAGCNGIVVFSYAAANSEKEHNKQQIKNMFDAIK